MFALHQDCIPRMDLRRLAPEFPVGVVRRRTSDMLDRHPPSERCWPIRRHALDPRRRKSSFMSRPLETGLSCSHWRIFSMTTSRPSWRSTVSWPLNPRALPGRLDFLTPWHTRTPRNASWTRFPLRDRRSPPPVGKPEWSARSAVPWSPSGPGGFEIGGERRE